MNHAQKRAELFRSIPRLYSGLVHIVLVHVMSVAIIVACSLQIHDAKWWELVFVPGFFVFANFFEYFVHKGPLHHRTKGLDILFDRHTLTHHAYFHHDTMKVTNKRELRFVLFPLPFMPLALVVTSPIPLALWWLVSHNLAWLFLVSAVAYYLVYEWFHTWHHLFPNTAVAAHHLEHHNPAQMTQANFNVSFPLADVLLGTRVLGSRAADHRK